ncbi:DUF2867 domain-containing protein [Paraburkholderia sp. XV]|uniref:DUF2867 domain-containing protein n=1 Tax=Paraburkholderia sp. XV TaxID=2831520 RepID=UPI001CD6B408|nr:DUF2867 domain-containing protein [Paraburkholderia sp. XV]
MHTEAKIEQAGLPVASQLTSFYGRADFADAFSIDLPDAASQDAERMARRIFDHPPEWIAALLKLRDWLVRPFGLKRAADFWVAGGDRVNMFRVFRRYPNEIVLGGGRHACEFPRVGIRAAPNPAHALAE